MLRRFQFSLRDLLWITAVIALLLCVATVVIRNPWLKVVGVGLLVGLVCAVPTVFSLLSQRGDGKYSEPFISRTTMLVFAIVAGVSLPFLVIWFMTVLMQSVKGR